MDSLKNPLIIAIIDYGNSEAASNFDAEDMSDYLIEVIDKLLIKAQDMILDTYNKLMICPHFHEIIAIGSNWTPNYCKECGKPLICGNQVLIK